MAGKKQVRLEMNCYTPPGSIRGRRGRFFQRACRVVTARAGAIDVACRSPLDRNPGHDRPDKPPREESKMLGAVVMNDCIGTDGFRIRDDLWKEIIDAAVAPLTVVELFEGGVGVASWGVAGKETDAR